MNDLQYFDCNVQVGKSGYKHVQALWRSEDILATMDQCGIAGALVYHGMGKSHSPLYGNRMLAEELANNKRFFGCWVVMPDQAGDFLSPETLIDNMAKNNIGSVKIFPRQHQFGLDYLTIGNLFGSLEQENLPVLVDASEISFEQLAALLEAYPDLIIILQGLSWGQERRLFPLMDVYKHLYVEFSALQSNAIIETAYERYGAERLLFGSGMPSKSPGAARALIDYARIPNKAKRLIAGGNLARLLNVKQPSVPMPDQDAITAQCSRGLPIKIPVYDSHTHLIEDGGGTGSGFPMLKGDIAEMISLYRTIGIQKMSIAPWVGINGGDSEAGNLVAEKAIEKYPDEVEGYVVIDPNYVKDVEVEARKWHLDKGFRGMKPYFFLSRIPYTDPVYESWWKLGDANRLYALIDPAGQSDEAYMAQIEELAQRYPNVAIFMDHAARSFEIAEQYVKVAKKHTNVYLQLTYTTVTLGAIEYLVKEVGVEKVLFGTDSPMRDPRPQVGWLAYANLSLKDKKAIFGGNMKRIWERCLI